MRLDKFLASVNVGTRTEVKKYIKNGRIKVNDIVANDPAMKVNENSDNIQFDGCELTYEQFRYYMFNKPAGCVSATKDKLSDTVLMYLDGEITEDLFPVGRLDKDTEGFLLITNDGKLAHNLLSPKKHVDKTYQAYVTGDLSEEQMNKFREGLDIGDDKKTLPAKIRILPEDECPEIILTSEVGNDDDALRNDRGTWYEVIIHEGRYHQIKRMFEALNQKVIYLKRVSMGDVCLDENLKPGEYRRLNENELNSLENNN